MMKTPIAGALIFLFAASGAWADERDVTLAVENMTCGACAITVTMAIERVAGVQDVAVDYDTKQADVRYDDTLTTWQAIAQASTNAGYPASKAD